MSYGRETPKDFIWYMLMRLPKNDAKLSFSELRLASILLLRRPVYAQTVEISVLCSLVQEAVHHNCLLVCIGGSVVGRASHISDLRTW
jgi:hypothetical protein